MNQYNQPQTQQPGFYYSNLSISNPINYNTAPFNIHYNTDNHIKNNSTSTTNQQVTLAHPTPNNIITFANTMPSPHTSKILSSSTSNKSNNTVQNNNDAMTINLDDYAGIDRELLLRMTPEERRRSFRPPQKARRNNTELTPREKWYCIRGCGVVYKNTSTKSIRTHQLTCTYVNENQKNNTNNNIDNITNTDNTTSITKIEPTTIIPPPIDTTTTAITTVNTPTSINKQESPSKKQRITKQTPPISQSTPVTVDSAAQALLSLTSSMDNNNNTLNQLQNGYIT